MHVKQEMYHLQGKTSHEDSHGSIQQPSYLTKKTGRRSATQTRKIQDNSWYVPLCNKEPIYIPTNSHTTILPSASIRLNEDQSNEHSIAARTLFDSGFTLNLVTEELTQKLDAVVLQSNIPLSLTTLDGTSLRTANKVLITLPCFDTVLQIECLTTKSIANLAACPAFPNPHNVVLNESFPRPQQKVDILLGQGAIELILGRRITQESLTLIETPWGWIPAGTLKGTVQAPQPQDAQPALMSVEALNETLSKAFQLDAVKEETKLTVEELDAFKKMKEIVTFDEKTNQFTTDLLFKKRKHLSTITSLQKKD